MEKMRMGKVIVNAAIENLGDLLDADRGRMTVDQVRRINVTDALVDTGASTLMLPRRFIQQLGLTHVRDRPARTVGGTITVPFYGTVRLTVQGRDCTVDVGEIRDDLPVLIGQVPLELMDWVVDPNGQRLIGNPDHGGEQMIDVF